MAGMDFNPDQKSSEDSKEHAEPNASEGDPTALIQRLGSSSSAYSSSSGSSEDSFFQIYITGRINSNRGTIAPITKDVTQYSKSNEDAHQTFKAHSELDGHAPAQRTINNVAAPSTTTPIKDDESSSISSSPPSHLEEPKKGFSGCSSPFPVSDLTDELHILTSTQSPPVQVMERSEGYEPDRIPPSAFAKSTSFSPADWSVASNDSLFSIHVGNNSFTRQQFSSLGGDLGISGELFSPSLPVTTEEDRVGGNNVKFGANEFADETTSNVTRPTSDSQTVSSNSLNMSHYSDGSDTSNQSATFPVKKTRPWSSGYCFNCGWALRYCTWPSCYCTWPRCYCSNCSWVFCYGWRCSQKRLCCFSSTTLEKVKGSSRKVKYREKPLQDTSAVTSNSASSNSNEEFEQNPPQATKKVTSNSVSSKWFSWFCFSCISCTSCNLFRPYRCHCFS